MRTILAIAGLVFSLGGATHQAAISNVTPRLSTVTIRYSDFAASEPGETYPAEAKILTLKPRETFLGIMGRVTQPFNDTAAPTSLYVIPETVAGQGTYLQPALNPTAPTEPIGGLYPLVTPRDIQGGWSDVTAPFEVGATAVNLEVYPDAWNGDGTTGSVTYRVLVGPAP